MQFEDFAGLLLGHQSKSSNVVHIVSGSPRIYDPSRTRRNGDLEIKLKFNFNKEKRETLPIKA